MARNVTIQDIDKGYDGLVEMFKDIREAGVEVGLFEDDGIHPNANGATIAEVGTWNEFGTDTIPERPFLRTTYAQKSSKFADEAQAVMGAVIDRRLTVNQGLQIIGATQATAVKESINDWTTPPNAEETIARKGKNDPLVETRLMRDSVKFKKVRAVRSSI